MTRTEGSNVEFKYKSAVKETVLIVNSCIPEHILSNRTIRVKNNHMVMLVLFRLLYVDFDLPQFDILSLYEFTNFSCLAFLLCLFEVNGSPCDTNFLFAQA